MEFYDSEAAAQMAHAYAENKTEPDTVEILYFLCQLKRIYRLRIVPQKQRKQLDELIARLQAQVPQTFG